MNKLEIPEVMFDPHHQQYQLIFINIDPVQARIIRNILLNGFMDTDDYKSRQDTPMFFQGFTRDKEEGKQIMVEFWTNDMNKIEKFRTYLDSQVNNLSRYDETKEYMGWD